MERVICVEVIAGTTVAHTKRDNSSAKTTPTMADPESGRDAFSAPTMPQSQEEHVEDRKMPPQMIQQPSQPLQQPPQQYQPKPPPKSPRSTSNTASSSNSARTLPSDVSALHRMNWPLIDSGKWGWTAVGGIGDVLTPHERARRPSTKKAFLRTNKRKRDRAGNMLGGTGAESFSSSQPPPQLPTKGSDAMAPVATAGQGATRLPPDPNETPDEQKQASVGSNIKGTLSETVTGEKVAPVAMNGESSHIGTFDGHAKASNVNGTATPAGATTSQPTETPSDKTDSSQQQQNSRGDKVSAEPSNNDHLATASSANLKVAAHKNSATSTSQKLPDPASTTATSTVLTQQQVKETAKNGPLEYHALHEVHHGSSLTADGAAVWKEQVLDIYTYHRGREGTEVRSAETGNWLTDLDAPTDTNHSQREPDTGAAVHVQFPLSDSQSFRETIPFDLVALEKNQGGATPMQLATEIALEFGLSFAETTDLAEAIEKQTRTFHRDHNPYTPPVASIEPLTGEKRDSQLPRVSVAWHGQVTNQATPGCHVAASLGASTYPSLKDRRSVSAQGVAPSRAQKTAAAVADKPAKKVKNPSSRRGAPKDEVEQIYRDEVKRRMQQFSKNVIKAVLERLRASGESNPEKVGLSLQISESVVCHICRQSRQGVLLPCGQPGHYLCMRHLEEQLGISQSHPSRKIEAACPICSLRCPCRACATKFGVLAKAFKTKCLEQRCMPVEVSFPELWETAQSLNPPVQSPRKRSEIKLWHGERKVVPKIPAEDLPLECCNGVDLDPGSRLDYVTVFSNKGAKILPEYSTDASEQKTPKSKRDADPPPVPLPRSATEDGSVDFCNVCKKPGNLQCCDYCPRAFHAECLKADESTERTPWMCPSCTREKEGMTEDSVDGSDMIPYIQRVYGFDADDNIVLLISKIHGMLVRLTNYDFGNVFANPVEGVIGYDKIIKNPMDLGTILSKLENGSYLENDSLKNVGVGALNDVELVWQNCFTFNFEGSAVYRMAEVLRRRAHAIRIVSFDHLLDDEMKEQISSYRSKFGKKRSSKMREIKSPINSPKPAPRPPPAPPGSRHRIMVTGRGNHAARAVGVLDPDSCRIVRMYSTMTAAIIAAEFLFTLKQHTVESDAMKSDTRAKVRKLIHDSTLDPFLLFYGYRWIFMDCLKSGEVKFPEPNDTDSRGAKPTTSENEYDAVGDGVDENGETMDTKSVDGADETGETMDTTSVDIGSHSGAHENRVAPINADHLKPAAADEPLRGVNGIYDQTHQPSELGLAHDKMNGENGNGTMISKSLFNGVKEVDGDGVVGNTVEV